MTALPPKGPSASPKRVRLWLPLAHHRPEQLERCVLVPCPGAPLALCARCLGLYPVLFLTLVLQGIWRVGPWGTLDWWIVLGASVPGFVDWALAWTGLRQGSNTLRILTGMLLGLALGRSLWLYFRDPLDEILWVQLGLLGAGAVMAHCVRLWRSW